MEHGDVVVNQRAHNNTNNSSTWRRQQIAHDDNVDIDMFSVNWVCVVMEEDEAVSIISRGSHNVKVKREGGKWKWHIKMNEGLRLIKKSLKGMDD